MQGQRTGCKIGAQESGAEAQLGWELLKTHTRNGGVESTKLSTDLHTFFSYSSFSLLLTSSSLEFGKRLKQRHLYICRSAIQRVLIGHFLKC